MSERKLVTLRMVDEIQPIEGADKIVHVRFGGWWVVSGKDNFKVGDWAAFFEVDSFIPVDKEIFKFLEPKAIDWNGRRGARIKTIKLRGALSQGLALPFNEIKPLCLEFNNSPNRIWFEGLDISEDLGVVKWEPLENNGGRPQKITNWPSFFPKTDQERVQNLWSELPRFIPWQVTKKMDGSSMSVFIKDGVFHVCSRNYEIEEDDSNFWKAARELELSKKVAFNGVFQGELIGPGVNGNRHKLTKLNFVVFDIFNPQQNCYFSPEVTEDYCRTQGIEHVPIIHREKQLKDFQHFDDILNYADSFDGEGVVFKRQHLFGWTPNVRDVRSFKVISNKYLLKHDL